MQRARLFAAAQSSNLACDRKQERAWKRSQLHPLGCSSLSNASFYLPSADDAIASLRCCPDGACKCLRLLKMMENGEPAPNAELCKAHSRPDAMMELTLQNSGPAARIFFLEGESKDCGGSRKSRGVCKAAFLALASLVLMLLAAGSDSDARSRLRAPFAIFSGPRVELLALAPRRKSFALCSARVWMLGAADKACDLKEIVEAWATMWLTAYFAANQRHLGEGKVSNARRAAQGKALELWKDHSAKKTSRGDRESRDPASRSHHNQSSAGGGGADAGEGPITRRAAKPHRALRNSDDALGRPFLLTSEADDSARALRSILRRIRAYGVGERVIKVENRVWPRKCPAAARRWESASRDHQHLHAAGLHRMRIVNDAGRIARCRR